MRASGCAWSIKAGCVAAAWAAMVTMPLPTTTLTAQSAAPPAPPRRRRHRHRQGSTAESERRRDRRRSPEHDGAARDHRAAAGAERQRVGAQPRQLRRGAGQSVPEAAGRPDARERPEGHERRRVVEAATAGDRRGVRSRGPRTRAEGRAEGHVGGLTAPRSSRSAGAPVVGKELVGKVDNASYPAITVDIQMTVVTPAGAARPVPVMMMFGGRSGMPPAPGAPPPAGARFWPGPRVRRRQSGARPPIRRRPSNSSPTAGATRPSAPTASRRTTGPV